MLMHVHVHLDLKQCKLPYLPTVSAGQEAHRQIDTVLRTAPALRGVEFQDV
jgi:hypothetical protein